ncbi:hypothetical protein ACWDHW_22705 [Streptomyces melanosporofaciens]|uniref:hypothetical protein n=1 Tax=unclassified Streptomyces TaxID=2593676 RepID=UPI0036BB8DC2
MLSDVDFTRGRVRALMPETLSVMARDAAELMPGRIGDSTLFRGALEEMAAGR